MSGTALRNYRVSRVLTQKEVAEAVGVSPEHLSRLESGQHVPGTTLMRKLAEYYGIEPAVFRDVVTA